MISAAADVIASAIQEHNPIKVFALVSGGNDSTVASHLACEFGPRLDALVHINTGIAVPETLDYVRSFASWLEVPLIEKSAPRSYEDLVMKYGFPGPAAHRFMYIWLKERALRQVRREAQMGQRRRVLFITGVREQESRRRMGSVQPIKRDGNTVWVAPIASFTTRDVVDYRMQHGLPANEVADLLHMSGECLCGAFSKPGELSWLSMFYPDVAARIRRLEARAHDAGLKSCHWGPQSSRELRGPSPGPLCSDCSYEDVLATEPVISVVGAP